MALKRLFIRFSELLKTDNYDMGILSGDLMTYTPDLAKTEREIKYMLDQVRKPIFFIMGNDDGILGYNWTDTEYLKNIDLRKVEYKEYSFVGYQYTNPYVGGPFEKTEKKQLEDLPRLQELIDEETIFVSHGPAYGILDKTHVEISVGSKMLRRLVDQKKPYLHLFGHIHQSFGVKGNSINGAYPYNRKMVSIDLDNLNIDFIE